MEEPSEIASIFGGDEAQASRIPEDLRPVLLERWSRLRKELDSSRPDVSGASASDSAEARKDEDPSKFYTFYTWLEIFNSWIEYQFQRLLPHPNHVQRQKGVSVRVKFLVKLWFRKLLRATFLTKLTHPIHMITQKPWFVLNFHCTGERCSKSCHLSFISCCFLGYLLWF